VIIFQPAGPIRLGDFLNTNFNDKRWNSFFAAVAFVKRSGVQHIATTLRSFSQRANVKILVGIDLRGTSKEGLIDLLESIESHGEIWICHNENPSTFHPKVYIFSNELQAAVVVGSGNLTEGGLYTNYEAAIVLNLEFSRPDDRILFSQINRSINEWHNVTCGFSLRVTPELIEELNRNRYIVNEAQSRGVDRRERDNKDEEVTTEARLFSRIDVRKPPLIKRQRRRLRRTDKLRDLGTTLDIAGRRVLWKKQLFASDVQRQPGHPTGGLRLTQAGFRDSRGNPIDHTTYFRRIFNDFTWRRTRKKPFVEETKVPFEVFINRRPLGAHQLSISHKPSGEAGQRNYTSILKWGDLATTIQQMNLTGRTITLYGPRTAESQPYVIVIE